MEKTVASGSGNLELKQSEVFKAWDDFHDSMRRTTQAWLESLSEREKAVASREEQMEARESRFEADFSSRKFQLQRIERSMEEKVYEVAERDEDLQSLESSIQKRREDLALVEESVAEKKEEFERLENEFSAMTRRAERKVPSIRKTVRGYVTKMSKKLQSSIVKRRKEAELREAQWESDIKAKEEKLRAIANNIARCSDELRLQEERLEIVRKQAQSMCNAFDTCREEFELKEMKIDGLLKTLEEVEAQETNAESLQNPINAFLGEAREISAGSLRKSPEEHFLGLQTEERQFREGASELELRREECSSSRKSMEVRPAQVKIESLEQPHTITSTVPITNAEISYMQYLLKLQSEKDNFGNEVYGILRASSNPEEFVLRAMEGLYPLQSSGEAEESNVRIVRINCILLLEMLKEVAPQINSQVKVQAVKLVNDWVSRSKLTEIDYLEAFRFIQLIKSYSLTSEIDSNDVFGFLDAAGQHGLSFQLRQAVSTTNRSSAVPRIANAAEDLMADLTTSFLNAPWSVVHVKIQNFLRTSPDPASRVLCFVENSLSQDCKTGYLDVGSKFMSHYVSLFEQLLKISPLIIQPRVRAYAMKLAVDWNEKIRTTSVTSWDVLAFLHFLRTYRLLSLYEGAEILSMLEKIAQNDEALRDCNDGFLDEILKYIAHSREGKHAQSPTCKK